MQTSSANVLETTGFNFGVIGKSPSPPSLLRRLNLSPDPHLSIADHHRSTSSEFTDMRLDNALLPSGGGVSIPHSPNLEGLDRSGLSHLPASTFNDQKATDTGEVSNPSSASVLAGKYSLLPQNTTSIHPTTGSLPTTDSSDSSTSDTTDKPVHSALTATRANAAVVSVHDSLAPTPAQDVLMLDFSNHSHHVTAGDFYAYLSDLAQERAKWDELPTLRQRYREEHEELRRRHEETIRAVQREREQTERTFLRIDALFDSLEQMRGKQEKRWTDERARALRDVRASMVHQENSHALSQTASGQLSPVQEERSRNNEPQPVPDLPAPSQAQDAVHTTPPAPIMSSSSSAPQATSAIVEFAALRSSAFEPPPVETKVSDIHKPAASAALAVASHDTEVQRMKEYEVKKRAVLEAKIKASAEEAQRIRTRRSNEGSKQIPNSGTPIVFPATVTSTMTPSDSPPLSLANPVVATLPSVSSHGSAPVPATDSCSTALPPSVSAATLLGSSISAAKPVLSRGSVSEPGTIVPLKRSADDADNHAAAVRRPSPASFNAQHTGASKLQQPIPAVKEGQSFSPAQVAATFRVSPSDGQKMPINASAQPDKLPSSTVKTPVKQEPVQEPSLSAVVSALGHVQPSVRVNSPVEPTRPSSVAQESRERHAIARPKFNTEGDRSTRIVKLPAANTPAISASISPPPGSVSIASSQGSMTSDTRLGIPDRQHPHFWPHKVHHSEPANHIASRYAVQSAVSHHHSGYDNPMVNSEIYMPQPPSPSPPRGRRYDERRPPAPDMGQPYSRTNRAYRRDVQSVHNARNDGAYARSRSDRSSRSPDARRRPLSDDSSEEQSRGDRRSPVRARARSPRSAAWKQDRTEARIHEERVDRRDRGRRIGYVPPPSPILAPTSSAPFDSGWPGTPSPQLPSPDWTAPARTGTVVLPPHATYRAQRVSAVYPPGDLEGEPDLLGRLSTERAAVSTRKSSPAHGEESNFSRRGQVKNIRGGRGGNKRGGSTRAEVHPRSLSQRLQKQSLADRFGSP